MKKAIRYNSSHLVDRACHALLELTSCSYLLVERERERERERSSSDNSYHLTSPTLQQKVHTLNLKLWNAKFSLFVTQYTLKKELHSLISLLLNITISPYIKFLSIIGTHHTKPVFTLLRIEPKKSNAP